MNDVLPPTSDAPARTRLLLSPFYHSAVNSVTKPNKYVFCSQYFVDRWMPLLGGVGTQIVLYLRRLGFHNRVTGEVRDEIPVEISDIARGVGCSPRTVQYHLAENAALGMFIRKRERFEVDPRSSDGRRRQCENGFQIAMDDPVHDDDLAAVGTYILEQEVLNGLRLPDAAGVGSPLISSPMQKLRGGKACNLSPGAKIAGEEPGAESASPRCKNCTPKEKRDTKTKDTSSTLNVGEGVDFISLGNSPEAAGLCHESPPSMPARTEMSWLDRQAAAIVEELQDWGSESRHRQLLSICEQHDLSDLSQQALIATRTRLAKSGRRGLIARPGAYYASVLVKLLEQRQVFVPTAGEDDAEEVRRLVRQSLRLED